MYTTILASSTTHEYGCVNPHLRIFQLKLSLAVTGSLEVHKQASPVSERKNPSLHLGHIPLELTAVITVHLNLLGLVPWKKSSPVTEALKGTFLVINSLM